MSYTIERPTSSPFAMVLGIFVVGIGCGIWIDQSFFLKHSATHVKPDETQAPLTEQLVGSWKVQPDVADGRNIVFRADGTFDDNWWDMTADVKPGTEPPDPDKAKLVRQTKTMTGQYRWVDAATLEFKVQGEPSRIYTVVLNGPELTLKEASGKVLRFKRLL